MHDNNHPADKNNGEENLKYITIKEDKLLLGKVLSFYSDYNDGKKLKNCKIYDIYNQIDKLKNNGYIS